MAVRVCKDGHITGNRHCTLCGADAAGPLADRKQPIHERRRWKMKELRQFRAQTRVNVRWRAEGAHGA